MSVTVTSAARTASAAPSLPTAPARLARSRRLAGGSGRAAMGLTPTVSSFALR